MRVFNIYMMQCPSFLYSIYFLRVFRSYIGNYGRSVLVSSLTYLDQNAYQSEGKLKSII